MRNIELKKVKYMHLFLNGAASGWRTSISKDHVAKI
jgi:hypothetical protein